MRKAIKLIWREALDVFFPSECTGCATEGVWLCPDCFTYIKEETKIQCPSCRKPSADGRVCHQCYHKTSLHGLVVLCQYDNPLLQAMIHKYKYSFVKEIGKVLGQLYERNKALDKVLEKTNPILVPVPLHRRRYRFRGFNQAEVLAEAFAKKHRVEIVRDSLVRNRHTDSQVELKDRTHRMENVRDAFSIKVPEALAGKTVILIDDVCTTSATLEACAIAITKARPKEIWGVVLARGK